MQHAHDAFRGLLGGDALDGQRHDAPRPLLAFLPGLRLEVPEQDRRLALALVLDLLDQLGLGLGRVQTGRPFKDQPPLFGHVIELGSLAGDAGVELGQLTVALLDPSLLGVQPLLALGQPVLAALQVRSQLTDVLFEGARFGLGATAGFQRRRAGGKLGVPAQSLGVGLGSAANRQRLELGRMHELGGNLSVLRGRRGSLGRLAGRGRSTSRAGPVSRYPRRGGVRRRPPAAGAGGSASWTRRWSTSPGSVTSSRWARPAGGSRTSPSTGCSSRRRPGSRASCRSGTATRPAGRDEWAAGNLVGYLDEQRAATGRLPDDRTILVERFRDELGDWRVAVHSPFGARVNAPWALALVAALRQRYGVEAQAMHSDDGIVLRLPEADEPPPAALVVFAPDEVEAAVQAEVGGSALFASRFRECAARSLLLPRRTPGRRTPLWQQRQRSAHLLQVASRFTDFPVVLETMRECLQDVFDVPGLIPLMRDVETRRVRLVDVETPAPSPFARSLLFGYVGAFMYEGDTPLAERRAQALSLDPTLLAELLGQAELRELLSAEALVEVERELQRLTPDRRVRDREGTADLLRLLGDQSTAELTARGADSSWLAELAAARRVLEVRIGGEPRWAAIEDAGRLRDALGVPLPVGIPAAFLEPVTDPLGDLVARFARTHGPFLPAEVAGRLGLGPAVVGTALARLAGQGRVLHGEFRPGGVDLEWCDAEVLRALRRRSLAKLRAEVEPTPPVALARFLPEWQGVGADRDRAGREYGADGLLRVVEQLAGVAVPASALERVVLPARAADYRAAMLDELTVDGAVSYTHL